MFGSIKINGFDLILSKTNGVILMNLKTATLGFPRMGEFRDLKKAVESYWKNNVSKDELNSVAKEIRKRNWQYQQEQGIDYIPSNDFSLYDQILDLTCTLGN